MSCLWESNSKWVVHSCLVAWIRVCRDRQRQTVQEVRLSSSRAFSAPCSKGCPIAFEWSWFVLPYPPLFAPFRGCVPAPSAARLSYCRRCARFPGHTTQCFFAWNGTDVCFLCSDCASFTSIPLMSCSSIHAKVSPLSLWAPSSTQLPSLDPYRRCLRCRIAFILMSNGYSPMSCWHSDTKSIPEFRSSKSTAWSLTLISGR